METLADLNARLMQILPFCIMLLILMTGTWVGLRLFRVYLVKPELLHTDYLDSFQKLRDRGELSEEEYRLVRKRLSFQLSQTPKRSKSNTSRPSNYPPRNRLS